MSDDRFEAMLATMTDEQREKLAAQPPLPFGPWLPLPADRFHASLHTAQLPGADNQYCGHLTPHGLSWIREACPICTSSVAALHPCPFCGSVASLWNCAKPGTWYAYCTSVTCNAALPPVHGLAAAVLAWNRRA